MNKLINAIIISISVFLILISLIFSIIPKMSLSTSFNLCCFLIPLALFFITMIIQIKHQNNIGEKEKIRTFWLKGLFLIYVVFLISMVFLDHSFRSHTNSYFPSGYIFSSEHLETINIIPFKDLFRFDSRIGLLNFVVNLILLAPIGFFFPLLCANKNKSIKNFIVLILSSTFVIEIIQFLTATGSSDINDIILNTLGAIAFYMLMKTKLIKRLLEIILDLS